MRDIAPELALRQTTVTKVTMIIPRFIYVCQKFEHDFYPVMKPRVKYSIFGIIAIILYVAGLRVEVLGFAQRGISATGLMNPDGGKCRNQRTVNNNPGNQTVNQ